MQYSTFLSSVQEPSQGRYYSDYDGEEGGGTGDTTKGVKSNLIVSQTQPFKLTEKVRRSRRGGLK
jgi:hypothetical protein